MFDVLLKRGTVVDGTGNPWFEADVGIRDGEIAAIGDLGNAKSRRIVDVHDKIVCPGFIDIHGHNDYLILADPTAESKVCQGVTTDVAGNCGGSAAPQADMFWQEWWTPEIDERFKLVTRKYAQETLRRNGIEFDWYTMDEYLTKVEKTGIALNYANFVGHYTLRIAAYGEERRKPSDQEIKKMQSLLRQSIKEGGIGFSTEVGSHFIWEYELSEVVDLCRTTRECGGVFSYDINDYGSRMLGDLERALWVVEQAKVPTIISHIQVNGWENKGKAKYVLEMIEKARSRGLDVVADVMPGVGEWGLNFTTRLTDLLPRWAVDNLEAILRDSSSRERLRNALAMGESSDIFVAKFRTEEQKRHSYKYSFGPLKEPYWGHYVRIIKCSTSQYEGKSIAELTHTCGKDCFVMLFDILEDDPDARFLMITTNEEDLLQIVCHPLIAFGTDGGLVKAMTRPRVPSPTLYATFPLAIQKYVRETKAMRLEECVRKMTSLPAAALKLYDRGVLRPGQKADCVVFDYDEIAPLPALGDEKPKEYAKGIEYSIVNGEFVIDEGRLTGKLPGQVLRKRWTGERGT